LEESEAATAIPDYQSWSQLAGYFDGDGCMSIRKTSVGIPFTLEIALEFSDQSERQIRMIKRFLESRGIKTSRLSFRRGAWRVAVGTREGVTNVLESMIPYLFKKRNEAIKCLAYLSDKITGNDLQEFLSMSVKKGDREKVGKRADLPWTRSEGIRLGHAYVSSYAGRKPAFSPEEEAKILERYESGTSQTSIARSLDVSRHRVQSALRRARIAVKS
jgi:hypothetical protein